MTVAEQSVRPAAKIAPFTWDDIADIEDWRERLAWPVSMAEMRALGERVAERKLSVVLSLDDELERQIATVAAGRIVNGFLALAEAALVVQGEARQGIAVLGGPPELEALRDGGEGAVLADRHRGKGVFDVSPPRHARLRTIARAHSWTPLSALPATLLVPRATAISHNALLRRQAAKSHRITFHHAASIVAKTRVRSRGTMLHEHDDLVDRLVAPLMAEAAAIVSPWRERFQVMLLARLRPTVAQIAVDVRALRDARRLPENIWTGTNGAYTNRLVSAEVRRRGGEVTGFDHGGVTGISQVLAITAMTELMTASRFYLGTAAWAEILGASGVAEMIAPLSMPELIGAEGDPTFVAACLDTKPAAARRRVVYVGHPYRGLRQFAIAGTPDVIYWDMQSRVAQALRTMAVDVVCKPLPEGAFVGRRNPIEDIAPTSYKRFEEHLSDTDVFVFDAPTSTTFAEAMCTNRPVVLIDRGHYPLNPAVKPLVDARCRLVRSSIDEAGRIWPDATALEEAVCGGADTADPASFRHLFAGLC